MNLSKVHVSQRVYQGTTVSVSITTVSTNSIVSQLCLPTTGSTALTLLLSALLIKYAKGTF